MKWNVNIRINFKKQRGFFNLLNVKKCCQDKAVFISYNWRQGLYLLYLIKTIR